MTDTQQNSGSRKPKSKGKIAAAWAGISAAVAAVALFLTNVEKIVAVTKNWSQRSAAEPKLEPLRVDCEVFPLRAKPGAVVTIKVTPVARNAVIISDAAVLIQNFSEIDDDTVGSWLPETRGHTDRNGIFRLLFTLPKSDHWRRTTFTIYASKEGYGSGQTDVLVERRE